MLYHLTGNIISFLFLFNSLDISQKIGIGGNFVTCSDGIYMGSTMSCVNPSMETRLKHKIVRSFPLFP